MFANTIALKLQDNEELVVRMSTLVNELNFIDLNDDSTGDVSYYLSNIRAICDVLEDRVQSTVDEE